jgi:D-serine deaminase-like pyridoxal phosphate-dependent protein
VGVFVDVNPGMDRTGAPIDQRERIAATARAAGARLRGVHFYDGHLHQTDRTERTRAVHAGYDRLRELVRELEQAGASVAEVVTAGTPALLDALAYEGFAATGAPRHRVSAGTVVYHDARSQEQCPELGLRPAALVMARVVSRPAPDLATCDAGSKSLAAEAGDPCAVVLGRPDLEALRPSEEHLPLRGQPEALPSRGSILQLIPRHVCPTVNLAEQAALVDAGRLVDVVEVRARAHELLMPRAKP